MSVIHLGTDSPFSPGNVIRGLSSGAEAYVNESVDNYVLYHQNEGTGFVPFDLEEMQEVGTDLRENITGITFRQEIDRHSGQVLYVENRYRIIRDAEQQEDIKVVITI